MNWLFNTNDLPVPDNVEPMYEIVRFHADSNHPDHRQVMQKGLTLEEAQAHCNDPDTRGDGWFDGYSEEGNYS